MLCAFLTPLRQLFAAAIVARRGHITDALFFDDEAYRKENVDVARYVDAGGYPSCYEHYVRYGRWEGRRFVLRRWGLPEAFANRLCAVSAELETRLDSWAAASTFGELGHRLRSSDGAALAKPKGPWKFQLDGGPWRAPLPSWARRGGTFMLKLSAEPPLRAPFGFRALSEDGERLGGSAALSSKPSRATKRLLQLPRGAAVLEVESLDEGLRVQPARVSLRPLPEGYAHSRIIRRLIHHHPSFLGMSERGVVASLGRKAEAAERSLAELTWDAYESTFPPPVRRFEYHDWIDQVERPELARLDGEAPERLASLAHRPLISILVPTYVPDEAALRGCLDSVLGQSYPNWELCVVDDASPLAHVRQVLDEYGSRDDRIRVQLRSDNGHVCRASNDALSMARGELVALLDHDDLLTEHALLQVAEALSRVPDGELFYSDEDKIRASGFREQPHFKPAFDPDLLLGQNYLGHLLVVRTERVREVGGFRPGYEGSQDHDLVLRLSEGLTPSQIVHIPRVLYHWRLGETSTAASTEAKPYTADAGIAAVRDALERRGDRAIVEHAEVANCYRLTRVPVEPAPRVTVIVPTRDALPLLSTCIDTVLTKTDYPDFEIIIVDNGSQREETLVYLQQIVADGRVRVIRDDSPFNYSALNNRAVAEATGELVALLNNDIEVVDGSWLSQLAANASRPGVGCVGAKLHYPDGTIQHAGVVLGLHGVAGHPYMQLSGRHPGYYGRLCMTHSVSAVTAACLVVERRLYRQLGGLDERDLAVAFNDVDFCMRVQQAGYRNLLVPTVVLIHHESASRGRDHDEAGLQRFSHEVATMKQRWGKQLYQDRCYSPHLSLDHHDYSIRIAR